VAYEIIKQRNEDLSERKACGLLNVSRSGFTAWVNRPPPRENTVLLTEIQEICRMPRYGYRRVTAELHRRKISANHKRVLTIMRKHALLCKRRLFKPQTTNSKHAFRRYPNLVKDLYETGLNQAWVADITYIGISNKFAYLASILDRFSRKCIGWNLSKSLEAEGALSALQMALRTRKHLGLIGLIHHSDQGVQYACDDYTALLEKQGIRPSMSEAGNPYENAFAESFNKTIKVEEVYLSEYESFDDALKNIEKFIEEVYNKKRLHSSIGYMPPNEFEQQYFNAERT
jgi:transposase InsO family protein